MKASAAKKQQIFISYSSFDTEAKGLLERHLGVLSSLGDFHVWEDSQIGLGDDWFQEIQEKLETCAVAVLLISHDFLGSKFCMKEEVPVLLERRRRDGMMIAPILLGPCAWKIVPWLSAIQMFPRKAKPLRGLSAYEQAEEITAVVEAVHAHLEERKTETASAKRTAGRTEADVQPDFVVKSDTEFPAPVAVDLSRLPGGGRDVVGREKDLRFLNEAFDGDKQFNMVSLRAWGGAGKSTIVNKWCEYLAADNFRGAKRVFAWSFYRQSAGRGPGGTKWVTSADPFFDAALEFFGDGRHDDASDADDRSVPLSPWAKGERLAALVRREKSLLILDGLEPLQDEDHGIRDPALVRLIERLAEKNAGLCVITTRRPVKEFEDFPDETRDRNLDHLSMEAGRALLHIEGLRASDDLLESVSQAFGNHAFALNLLAHYVLLFEGGNVRKARDIPDLPAVSVQDGKHPRRVMAAFERKYGRAREVELLHVMGFFDRPVDGDCLKALRKPPAISGLTSRLSKLGEKSWRKLLEKLRRLGFLAEINPYAPDEVDAHPLVREHFGAQLRDRRMEAWRAGHKRLYEHLQTVPGRAEPDTLADMVPLFQAIRHGCQAGCQKEAFSEIYTKRVNRETGYLTKVLGAYGADLAISASFFDTPWDQPSADLSEDDAIFLMGQAGHCLRALGRVDEAINPVELASVAVQETLRSALAKAPRHAWSEASLELALGRILDALTTGEKAIEYADLSGDHDHRIRNRTTQAYALFQAGRFEEAKALFEEAEALQGAFRPAYGKLHGLRGYRYCELLLHFGEAEEVRDRAIYGLNEVPEKERDKLSDPMDRLVLVRSALDLGNYDKMGREIEKAIEGLRHAGDITRIPDGLIVKACFLRKIGNHEEARNQLAEALRISKRRGIRLHECHAHIESARLALAEDRRDDALDHYKSAQQLVAACGYHRRDREVTDIKKKLGL